MRPLWEPEQGYRLFSEKNAQTRIILRPISEQTSILPSPPQGLASRHNLPHLDMDSVMESAQLIIKPSPGQFLQSSDITAVFHTLGCGPAQLPQSLPWADVELNTEGSCTFSSGQHGCWYWTPHVLLDPAPLWSLLSLWWEDISQNWTLLSPKAMLSSVLQQRKVTPRSRTALTSSTNIRSSIILKRQEPWSQGQWLPTTIHLWKKHSRLPQHKSQTTVNPTTLHALLSHHTSACSRNQGKGKLHPCSLLTTLDWNSCSNPFHKSCPVSLILPASDTACFSQCLIHLTDGPGVTWAPLPLVKTPTGSPLPWGSHFLPHCHSS